MEDVSSKEYFQHEENLEHRQRETTINIDLNQPAPENNNFTLLFYICSWNMICDIHQIWGCGFGVTKRKTI